VHNLVIAVLLSVLVSACAEGKFVRKPAFTEQCETQHHTVPPVESAFTMLVWNIHDRAQPGSVYANDGHTEAEVVCIAEIAKHYDLVLFQESFQHPLQIPKATRHAWSNYPTFQRGGGGNWWPLRWLCEICRSPGLLLLAAEPALFTYAEPYTAFAGWHTALNKSDNFFSKGFQLVRFPTMWVLNSHNDAGRGQSSIDARRHQFRQITTALYTLVPHEAALLIGLDANLRPDIEPQDAVILDEFLKANHLTVIVQHGPDIIAARNLTVLSPQVLPLEDVLSDHDALSAVVVGK
jgi:hypothetical protein